MYRFIAQKMRSGSCSVLQRCQFMWHGIGARKPEPWQLYEPAPTKVAQYPSHQTLLLSIDAYDFVPIERFTSYAHKKARMFGFQVIDSYALPSTKTQMVSGDRSKKKVTSDIVLSTYHRYIKLAEVQSVRLQLYIDLLLAHIPVGVQISLKNFEEADEEQRYIPDEILESRKAELKSLDDPKVRKLLGWE